MSSLPYAEVKRIREAVTARVAREGKARGMDLSVRTRNVLRRWLCDNGVDALLPEPDELRIVMGCGDATAKEYSLWLARKPEPTRGELLEERDAARREAADLRARVEALEGMLGRASEACDLALFGDLVPSPSANALLRRVRDELRALLAPPPERAGEEAL